MSDLKTKENAADVLAFINSVEDEQKRKDCLTTLNLMEELTGKPARMWGASIVGFGQYHYKYKSGREGDWFLTGFSPRKQNFTIYIMPGFSNYESLLTKIGKHKLGKSCLYIKKLDDIDLAILEELIAASLVEMQEIYGSE